MRAFIFTKQEREALEAFLTTRKPSTQDVSHLLDKIKGNSVLFEDVYLYLQVRKSLGS
ncbi:MAG: hypothetical protein JSV35_08070 [Candidatus Bathyarchaeota archaeon]|nr:MAG: hypothetical protein JSV35_08070 [Candidatus Bathyarchaeota archaeon]